MIVNNGYTLLDNRFFGKGPHNARTSIFEQAGSALPVRVPASTAFEFFGEYEPEIIPLTAKLANGKELPTTSRGIFFNDKKKGLTHAATVGADYQFITPKNFCKLWDENVQLPIVAMGAKGKLGETFYIASDIGKLPIKGTDIQCNLMGVSPMDGRGSMSVRVTPVNMWCTNQMQASKRRALINARIPHKGDIVGNTILWMKHLKSEVEEAQKLIAGDFAKMMEYELNTASLQDYMGMVYVLPEAPSQLGPIEIVEKRLEAHEAEVKLVNTKREAFQHLFEGLMTGNDFYDSNNLFKAYNASAELAQYWKSKGSENKAVNSLLGTRAEEIENAYLAAVAMLG